MTPLDHYHEGGRRVAIAITFSMAAVCAGLVAATVRLGAAALPIWFVGILGLVLISRGPIGQALAARIHSDEETPEREAVVPPELYAELDELRTRLAELEERQDFSERLLSSRADAKEKL